MKKKRLKLRKSVKIILIVLIVISIYRPVTRYIIDSIEDVKQRQTLIDEQKQRQIDELVRRQFNK